MMPIKLNSLLYKNRYEAAVAWERLGTQLREQTNVGFVADTTLLEMIKEARISFIMYSEIR